MARTAWVVLVLAVSPACKWQTESAASAGTEDPSLLSSMSPAPEMQHAQHQPPIDCPLRERGIDPTSLKPFADTATYIEFLERADRAVWQRPDAVVAALGLQGDEVVYDVGSGSGYFSFPLARAVPRGKVVAADPEPDMVRWVHHTAMTRKVTNILSKIIDVDDPGVADDADMVFICDVLHHVPDRNGWLGKLVRPLAPGARVALIEFKEGDLPEGPPESVKLRRADLVALATGAGLELEHDHAGLLPYQEFMVFRKR